MNTQENDPDILQILDELDKEWVKNWRRETKKRFSQDELTVFLPLLKEVKYATKKEIARK